MIGFHHRIGISPEAQIVKERFMFYLADASDKRSAPEKMPNFVTKLGTAVAKETMTING